MATLAFPSIATPVAAPSVLPLSMGSQIASYGSRPAAVQAPAVTAATAPATPTPVTVPEFQGVGNMLKSTLLTEGGGLNLDNIGSLAQTIGAFGTLWSGLQSNKLAKESFEFQKDAYNTNMANQISSYNLALNDRITARYAQNGRSSAEADAYIAANSLKK